MNMPASSTIRTWHSLSAAECQQALHTTPQGLASAEAQQLLAVLDKLLAAPAAG